MKHLVLKRVSIMFHYFLSFIALIGFCVAKSQHGVSIYGELKYKDTFTHFDYNNPNAFKGGKFRYSVLGNFDSLNPYIVKGTPATGMFLVFGSLMTASSDESSSQYAFIAESIDVSEEHKQITFKINPKACFSDGVKITSADVKFSFDMLREKGLPTFRSYYKNVMSCETPDEHTIVFHMESWNRELPYILAQIPVLPRHFYERHPFDQTSLISPPSSGPYIVKEVKIGERIILERIHNWWAECLPSQRGANNFETIEFHYFRDDAAQFEAFKRGLIDLRYEGNSKTWAIGYDFPAVKEGHVIKKAFENLHPKPTYGIFINTRRSHLVDKRVRKALTIVLDFDWLNKNVFYGIFKRNHSFFPVSVFEAKGLPNNTEVAFLKEAGVVDEDVYNTPYALPEMIDQKEIRKTISDALDLFAEAGWHIQNQQMTHLETKTPFVLEMICSNPRIEKIALAYQNSLKKLGIKLTIRLLDNASYEERLANYDYDLALEGIPQSATPGNEQREFFGSKAGKNQGGKNYAGIQSDAIDRIVERLIASTTYDQLTTATKALDRVLLHEYIMIPGWHFNGYMTAYWDRFGGSDQAPAFMGMVYPMVSWWYDELKSRNISQHQAKPDESSLFERIKRWFK